MLSSGTSTMSLLVVALCLVSSPVHTFVVGDVPEDSSLDGYVWRRNDLPNLLHSLTRAFLSSVFSQELPRYTNSASKSLRQTITAKFPYLAPRHPLYPW